MGFAFSFFTGSAELMFVAAIIAAAVYLPVFLLQRRRNKNLPILRHAANYALCGYLLLLVYAVFLYGINYINYLSGYDEAAAQRLNLRPLTELFSAMFEEAGILGSQVTLNVLLFVPLGFLLPLVFPNKLNRFWKVALCALCTTFSIEAIQYFIGRSADIDDILANTFGGMLGFCLLCLCDSIFSRRVWWKKLCVAQIPRAKWRTVCTGLALLLSIGIPLAIDIASTHSRYGLLRYATSKIPENAILNIPLSDKAGEVPLCSYAGDYLQTLRSVLAALEIKPETEEALQAHIWGGASYIDNQVHISIQKQGNWCVRWRKYDSDEVDAAAETALPGRGKELSNSERLSLTGGFFEPFLLSGESLAPENASFIQDDEAQQVTVTVPVNTEDGIAACDAPDASVSAIFRGEDMIELSFNVVRLKKLEETVEIISERDAYDFARRYGNLQIGGGRWSADGTVLDAVSLNYGDSIYGANLFHADVPMIPYYVFSGTYRAENGEVRSWSVRVDALLR